MTSRISSKIAAFAIFVIFAFAGAAFAAVSIDSFPAVTPDNLRAVVLSGTCLSTTATPYPLAVVSITDGAWEAAMSVPCTAVKPMKDAGSALPESIETGSAPGSEPATVDSLGAGTAPVPGTWSAEFDLSDFADGMLTATASQPEDESASLMSAKISGIKADPSFQAADGTLYAPSTFKLLAPFSFTRLPASAGASLGASEDIVAPEVACEYIINGEKWLPAEWVADIVSTSGEVSGQCVANEAGLGESGPASMRASYGKESATAGPLKLALDADGPVITGATDISQEADSPSGAAVAYGALAAVDSVSGTAAVSCTPSSGKAFPIGTSVVTCTAADALGNTATATFKVTLTEVSPAASVPQSQSNNNGGGSFIVFPYAPAAPVAPETAPVSETPAAPEASSTPAASETPSSVEQATPIIPSANNGGNGVPLTANALVNENGEPQPQAAASLFGLSGLTAGIALTVVVLSLLVGAGVYLFIKRKK